MHGTVYNTQLDMIESLLREKHIDLNCRLYFLKKMMGYFDSHVYALFLDAQALDMWDDFKLSYTDLNKDAIGLLSNPALLENFSARNVVRSCDSFQVAQLLKKETQDRLLSKIEKEKWLPKPCRDEFTKVIAMRLLMKRESNRLQDISRILLDDLKRFCVSEEKNITEVFNTDINDDFLQAVIKYVDEGNLGALFSDTDLLFYQASNLVKLAQNLPTQPELPQWILDFLHKHPLFQKFQQDYPMAVEDSLMSFEDNLEMERHFLWRMEIHLKILEPLNKLRNRALFVPLLLGKNTLKTPFLHYALLAKDAIQEVQEFLGNSHYQRIAIT